ncbi:sigma-54-dependent transcriptional regulator [Gemmatimonadota bacterium]
MIILLVDDDHDIRKTLSKYLRSCDHQVMEAGNGQEALDVLNKQRAHMVLSDIQMPVMNGYELLDQIKSSKELEDTEVILFTGFGEIKKAIAAMRNGARDYLLKPVDLRELNITVERIGEYLALKQENKELTDHFQNKLNETTKEIRKELDEIKEAYARQVGVGKIGIFSDKLQHVFRTAKRLHRNRDIPVMIEGETGTGKELIARYIHYGSGDTTSPFVAINCAAISSSLFESELFGYESGAFTGASPRGQKGKIELAQGGTLLLDEIGDMAPEHQAKLLRVIQEKEYYRVGGLKKITCDVRLICATNRDLKKMVAEESFREDLYYRLNVGYIRIPPLRERREEILPLAEMFLKELYDNKKTHFKTIHANAAEMLEEHDWPGNIREMKSIIERLALLWDDAEISPGHLDFLRQDKVLHPEKIPPQRGDAIDEFTLPEEGFDLNEWINKSTLGIIRKAMDRHHWNKSETARYLGITRTILYRYMKQLETKK